jgi:hypothetical protein
MFSRKYQTALVVAIAAAALWGSGDRLPAEETRLRLQGCWSDGTRHLDKLYLREPAATPRFRNVSFSPERLPASVSSGGVASSDEQGQGAWHLTAPFAYGNWRCLEAVFADGLRLTIWINTTSGNVLYYGHDATGRVLVAGRGDSH